MRLKLNGSNVSAQLELPFERARPANDDDVFASHVTSHGCVDRLGIYDAGEGHPRSRKVSRYGSGGLTLADCYARSGPSGTEGYEQ